MHFAIIPLNRVDQTNETFRITTRTDVDDLAASIASDGLITPPVLVEKDRGLIIVSGFRRIAACRQLNCKQVPAAILTPDPGPDACLRMAIAANSLQRPLNLIEVSRSLQKLASCLAERPRLVEAARTLGLPTNPSMIDKMIGLCQLPAPLQEGLLNGRLALPIAIELGTLDQGDAVAFSKIFNSLGLSLNKQREIISLVKEISKRDDIRVQDVLQDQRIRKILNADNPDHGWKTREIRSLLNRWRYPAIAKARQEFESHLKNLKLGPDIKMIPPKNFEATTYTLQLSFDSLERLKKLQAQLGRILHHPSLAQILARSGANDD